MPISVKCDGCDKTLRVSEAKRGKRVKCPACGEVFRIPDDEDEDDFATAELEPSESYSRPVKRRKKKSSGGDLTLPIGIAVGIVLLVGLGFVVSRMLSQVATMVPKTIEQQPNVATINQTPIQPTIASTPANQQSEMVDRNTNSPATPTENKNSDSMDDDESKVTPQTLSESDEFFTNGVIPELRIEISDSELDKLKEGPRTFVIGSPRPQVQCTIRENGKTTYDNVAIKLKGSAGSFRPVDDRPALSINVAKFEKDQSFHGMTRFHLNNSVQDDTLLHEWLCEELFRAAKLPATRVTHARVWLNDRDLGLYVLKSSFDKSFLKRHFKDAKGNLYEGGFLQDIDVELERDSGKGADDRSDLTALLETCREPNPETRWERIDSLLNVEQFISFTAMEMMIGHWDGYTTSHNNYRIYFEPTSNQAHFLPHGMDQVFGNPGASIIDLPSSIVSSAVMLNGEWRARYRERLGELLSLFSPTENLIKRIDLAYSRLRPVLANINPQLANDHDVRISRLKERIVVRVASLIQQQSLPDPEPREFKENGRLTLADWKPVSESPDATLEVVDVSKGVRAYSILCGAKGRCNASWRCKELLAKGTYRLHANIRTNRVNAPDEKNIAVGAGVRVAGVNRNNVRKGTANWTPIEFEFTVMEDLRTIEFIAELRARKGQVWFEENSFYLTRKPE